MGEVFDSMNNHIKMENEHEAKIKKIISIDNDDKREREIKEIKVKLNLELKEEELRNLIQRYQNWHIEQMLKLKNEHEEKLNKIFSVYKCKSKENKKKFYKDMSILQNKKNKINKFILKTSKKLNPKIKKMFIYMKKQ